MGLFQKPAGAADDAAPLSGKGGNAAHPCPEGISATGCSRYGTVCLRPSTVTPTCGAAGKSAGR